MITIESFQGGLSNDRNQGQKGAFWDSRNIEFRKYYQHIELGRKFTESYSYATSNGIPTCMNLDGNVGTVAQDICVFTNQGKVINGGSVTTETTGATGDDGFVNYIVANSIKYIIGRRYIHTFTNRFTITEGVADLGTAYDRRPVINFYGDLIIGHNNSVARYNRDGSVITYNSSLDQPVIGGLDGEVYAITQIGTEIYVWCNNGSNTTQYIWDGLTSRPSSKIVYTDTPVINVALLGNQHYFWTKKSEIDKRSLFIGSSYQPQLYIRSDYPISLTSATDYEANRLAFYGDNTNAIETLGDIILLPGKGRVYGFGRMYPGQPYSLSNEFTVPVYENQNIQCMLSGYSGTSDGSSYVACAYRKDASNYGYGLVNYGYTSGNPVYESSGYIETMEYVASNIAKGEDNVKIVIPFELPHSSTSIKIYVKRNRGSYTEIKTINTTGYGTGYNVAEISDAGNWRTLQLKIELITTNGTYSPKVFNGITIDSQTTGAILRR